MGPVRQSHVVCGWGMVSFSFSFWYNLPLPPTTTAVLSGPQIRDLSLELVTCVLR